MALSPNPGIETLEVILFSTTPYNPRGTARLEGNTGECRTMSVDWHPSRSIRGSVAGYLQGRCIIVGVTGSVAAYRSLDTARWLLRRGARVIFAATRPALEFLGEKLLHWATGERPVTDLTGEVEHISLARECDGIVVAPATLSTISKIANGIADNPVSTIAVSMIGMGKRVIIVPAMHANMMRTPQYRRSLELLALPEVLVVPPLLEEGVAKYPDPYLIARVASAFITRGRDLNGRRVIVTGGPTREWLDRVRFISNPSSGRMGVELAVEAWARGARVTLVHGPIGASPPHMLERVRVETTREMRKAVESLVSEGADALIASAAPVDFTPSSRFEGKIRSGERLQLELVPTPKVIEGVRDKLKVLAAFAAESVEAKDALIEAAMEKMRKYNADIVVANRVGFEGVGFAADSLDAILIWNRGGRLVVEDLGIVKKEFLAGRIIDTVALLLSGGED